MHPNINRAIFAAFALAAISLISLSTLFSNHLERAFANDAGPGSATEIVRRVACESPDLDIDRPFVRALQAMPTRATR